MLFYKRMNAIILIINRKDLSADPVSAIAQCQNAWEAVYPVLSDVQEMSPSPPEEIRGLFEGLCRWRNVRAKSLLPHEECRRCHYLVQCAVRLLLLDRTQHLEEEQAASLRSLWGEWAHPLRPAELQEVSEFAPVDRTECAAQVVAAGEAWGGCRTEPGLASRCAFAVLFTDEGDTRVPTELLDMCERLDRFNAARDALAYAMVRRAEPEECHPQDWPSPDARASKMSAWARSKAAASFSDDVRQAFVEALIRTKINPVYPFEEGERPAAILGRVQPDRANAVIAEVQTGVRLLESAAIKPADEDTITIHLFCYYMDQMHGVDWSKNFYITHHSPFGVGACLFTPCRPWYPVQVMHKNGGREPPFLSS
jgi:hypothetical protein